MDEALFIVTTKARYFEALEVIEDTIFNNYFVPLACTVDEAWFPQAPFGECPPHGRGPLLEGEDPIAAGAFSRPPGVEWNQKEVHESLLAHLDTKTNQSSEEILDVTWLGAVPRSLEDGQSLCFRAFDQDQKMWHPVLGVSALVKAEGTELLISLYGQSWFPSVQRLPGPKAKIEEDLEELAEVLRELTDELRPVLTRKVTVELDGPCALASADDLARIFKEVPEFSDSFLRSV